MRKRLLLLTPTVLLVGAFTAMAAPIGSAYRTAVDALQPYHYFPFDQAPGTQAGTAVTDVGSSATKTATFVNRGAPFNDGSLNQGTGDSSYSSVGATIGPAVESKFTSVETDPSVINAQLPGFNPDLRNPAQYNIPAGDGVNRAFETNRSGAVNLGSNVDYRGDPTTHQFTYAGWVRMAGGNSGIAPRIFELGGDNGANGPFFQIVTQSGGTNGLTIGTSTTDGRKEQIGYAGQGLKTGGESVQNDGQWAFIVASVNLDPALTPAQRAATIQLWERDRDATHLLTSGSGLGQSNTLGVAKLGYRDLSGGAPGATQMISDKMDEVAIFNRTLAYNERESLYVAATGSQANSTTADGSFTDATKWSTGAYPQTHGNNNAAYNAVTINNNMTHQSAFPSDTAAWRSDLYSMAINSSGSLTQVPGSTIRTYADMSLNGNVTMNGNDGTVFGKNVSPPANSELNAGGNVTVGGAITVTMASVRNQILAEKSATINPGAAYALTSFGTSPPSTGAALFPVMEANSSLGSGSLLNRTGTLNGQFTTYSLPADDGLGRRASVLYENRSATGVGAVDTMKIGLAQPGDLNFDGKVDFNDAFELTNNYGTPSGANWRTGDFNGDGAVNFSDAFEQVNFYGSTYSTTLGTTGDGKLTLIYDPSSGKLMIEGPAALQFKSLSITSASGILHVGTANWSHANGAGYFVTDTTLQQGFATNTALGGSFLVANGYDAGVLLDPNLSLAFLLNDLTIKYGVQGQIGTLTGDLAVVPEPASVFLALAGLAGVVGFGLRRRVQPAC